MQYGQVEAAAVPGHQLGRVLLDAIEESLDDLALIGIRLGQENTLKRSPSRSTQEMATTRCR